MDVLYDTKCAMCPAEPDNLASGGCSDGCELLTGEVCEASWWDGLLNGCEAEGPGAEMSEGQQADTCMVSLWSVDSGLDDGCGIPPFTDLGHIPCMADELEHFSEQLTHSLPCAPETPSPAIQNCLSSSNVSALSGGNCGGKAAVPVIFTAPPAAAEAAAEATTASPPYRGVLTAAALNQQQLKGEEEEGGPLSPTLRALRMKLSHSLENAVALRDGCSPPFAGAWRGCVKSSWCNRENRHRGVCNTRAEVPGLAAYGPEALAAEGVRGADFPGHWPLEGIKEEGPARDDLDDSEQASATEVLLERGSDPDAQCLDSGVPRQAGMIRLDGQVRPDDCQGRTRLRLVVKRQPPRQAAVVGSPSGGPPTPELQAPLFASQDSSDSADSNSQRDTDTSSQDTGAADADEVRCSAHAGRSPPVKSEPAAAAAKTSERPRRASPSTPEAAPRRPASKPTPESLERSVPAPADPAVSPFAASLVSSPGAGRGAPPGGFVQTSSGRIARPTSKTAASRASSAELSELSHTEGQRAIFKRKSGRPSKGGEKSKRRRMVNGILKTVGHSAPGQECTQCGTQVTPVWRAGPYGPKTLCNACGVRYMKQVKKK